VKIQAVSLKVDDRIADDLSRSVKGDVAATLNFEQLDALAAKKVRRSDQVFLLGGAAECDYRRMLYEEEHILRESARDPIARDLPLQLERFLVRNPPQRNCP
jgi:hypothetical protein